MQIFIWRNNQSYGPYSTEQIKIGLGSGQLHANDLAHYEGATHWTPLSSLQEFQEATSPSASPETDRPETHSVTSGKARRYRKPSFRLAAGIMLMPFVFVWFTLRRGYSGLVRLFAFMWLIGLCALPFAGTKDEWRRALMTPTGDVSSGVAEKEESRNVAASYKATYDVVGAGTKSASITYTNQDGSTEQREVQLPWSDSFTITPGHFLYISAQNKNSAGSITVYISINGETRKIATSEGAYVIASSSYSCCR